MCVTQEVDESFEFIQQKSEYDDWPQELLDELGIDKNVIAQQKVNTVSRIQAAQAAIESQLKSLALEFPKRRAALVTFNTDVCIIGDGTQSTETISGDKLNNREKLIEIGKSYVIGECIEKSKDTLSKKLLQLQESGATALGPALIVSITMASQYPGSKVIIITDGLANVGLGNFETNGIDAAEKFYTETGKYANENDVTVSVVSIKGTNCRMENLGEVAQLTGGDVSIVDPTQLEKSCSNITKNPIVATNVDLRLLLPKYLYLTGPLAKDFENTTKNTKKESLQNISKHIGNAFADSEIAIQFGVHSDISSCITEVPFQAILHFKSLTGCKYTRVITHMLPLTSDLKQAANDVDIAVFSAVVGQVNASLAQQGQYSSALKNAKQHRAFLNEVADPANSEQSNLLGIYDQQLDNITNVIENQMAFDINSSNPSSTRNNRLDGTAAELYSLRSADKAACSIM